MTFRCGLVVFQLMSSAGIYAQTTVGFGTITGTIRDFASQGIPDTTVLLFNEPMGITRTMQTTDDGTFNASALVPASGYHLKVTRKGFVNVEYGPFEVQLGHTLHFRISMQQDPAAAQSQPDKASVRVDDTNYAPEISLTRPELDVLPTANRNVETLAALSSAITIDPSSGEMAFHSQPSTNVFLTDGILTTNTFYYRRTPVATPVTQDALYEVQILSASPSVDLTQTMGGTFNGATQSGTNVFHGAAYGYLNPSALNASARYANGFSPSDSRHQWGASAGGPIRAKKLFALFNAEDLQARTEEINRAMNPLITNSTGTAVVASNCAATAAQCASAVSFLNAQLNREVASSLTSFTGFARLDWRPNDSNTFNFEAGAMHRHAPNGTETQTVATNADVLGYNGTYSDGTRFARIGYTAVWSNVVNEIHIGWYRDRFSDYADTKLLPSTGALAINIAGTQFGGNPELPLALSEQHRQLVDNFSFALGSHSIRFGIDYSGNEDWNDQIIGSAGSYFYPTLTAFAQDFSGNSTNRKDYASFTQGFGRPVVDLHSKLFNIYAQDEWRPMQRLSVTYGVLWEKPFLPKPTDSNSTYSQTGTIPSPTRDLAPRVGAAYRFNDRMTVRLGFGTYYQPFSGELLEALFTGNAISQLGITATPNQTASPIFPKVVSAPNVVPSGTSNVLYAAGNLGNPHAMQTTLSVERKLSEGLTLSLGYANSRGVNLWTASDQNLTPSSVTKTYYIANSSGIVNGSYTTPIFTAKDNSSYAHIYQIENGGKSDYNGVTIQMQKRMSHGLAMQMSYTWSHSLDDMGGPEVVAGFIPVASIPGKYSSDKGNSSFNQPSRAVLSWIWQPTLTRRDSLLARYTINGWQLSGIGTLASSLAATPIVIVSGQQFSGVTMDYTNSLNGSSGWSRVPFTPINSLLMSPEYVVDARLTRQLPFSERVKGTLMLEAYNTMNIQRNTSVNTIAYVATNGILRPVSNLGAGTGGDAVPWGNTARHLQVALRIEF